MFNVILIPFSTLLGGFVGCCMSVSQAGLNRRWAAGDPAVETTVTKQSRFLDKCVDVGTTQGPALRFLNPQSLVMNSMRADVFLPHQTQGRKTVI